MASGWVAVIDKFKNFASSFDNMNLIITCEICIKNWNQNQIIPQVTCICKCFQLLRNVLFCLGVVWSTTRTDTVGSTSWPAGYRWIPLASNGLFFSLQIHLSRWLAFFILKQLHYGTLDLNDVNIFNYLNLFHWIKVKWNGLDTTDTSARPAIGH